MSFNLSGFPVTLCRRIGYFNLPWHLSRQRTTPVGRKGEGYTVYWKILMIDEVCNVQNRNSPPLYNFKN